MISDNNHIIYSAEDIQRYWNGQLTPQEMHAMEKAALDDPFLADAMEGFGQALEEHDEKMVTAQLASIHQHLQARGAQAASTAPVRSFRWWQAAAAALVLVVAGYWIFSTNSSENVNGIVSQQESPTVADRKAEQGADKSIALTDSQPAGRTQALRDSIEITAGLSSSPALSEEKGLYEFKTTTPKPKSDTHFLSPNSNKERPPSAMTLPDLKKQKQEQPTLARASAPPPANLDTISKIPTEVVRLPEGIADAEKTTANRQGAEPKLQNVVRGVVTDSKNNPLPNVFIRLDNKNSYTTDPLGNFKIPAADSVIDVSVSLPGYATQTFRLRSNHNGAGMMADNQIRLSSTREQAQQTNSAGFFGKKAAAKDDMAGPFPREKILYVIPVNGWLAYEQYLEKNKRIPASNPNLIGEVLVSFTVSKKGELSDFRIDKSLSPDHDAEAIRLIREGPAWKLTKGRKSRAAVIVRF
jgi:hypothetical protein